MDTEKPTYWFKAKRYGIGWSLPVAWQGWVTLAVYAALLIAGLRSITAGASRLAFVAVATILFVIVVAWKGERPFRWRWGGR